MTETRPEIKDSIVFYRSWHEGMKALLTPEQYIEVMEQLTKYYETHELKLTGDDKVDAFVIMCQHSLDENYKRYMNGKKGGRPKKTGGDA